MTEQAKTSTFIINVTNGDVRAFVTEILAWGFRLVRKNGAELEVQASLIDVIGFCADSDFGGDFQYEAV